MNVKEISALIRREREKQNITQAELAAASGLSRLSILSLESGKFSDLGIRKVANVLAAIGMELTVRKQVLRPTLDDLIKENQEMSESSASLRDRVRP